MKPIIVYFSPTGGTAQVARLIAGELGAETIEITAFGCELSFDADALVFFCFPVFGGRIPSPLYKRMESVSGQNTPAVQVAVFGNRAVDDALVEMGDLCKKHGFTTVAGCEMVAPHSLDRKYGAGRPDADDTAKLKSFLSALMKKEPLDEVSLPGNHEYRKYDGVPVWPVSGKGCTGCGTCAVECPSGAIDPSDPAKPDKSKCISCMRCVNMCPFEARRIPAAARMAVAVSLKKLCSGRKEVKFYL